jgi:hypothetical protein
MNLGSYTDLPLEAARRSAKELRAKIALGHDVAGERQERKSSALAPHRSRAQRHHGGPARQRVLRTHGQRGCQAMGCRLVLQA